MNVARDIRPGDRVFLAVFTDGPSLTTAKWTRRSGGVRGARRMLCEACWKPNAIGFIVPDEVWEAGVPPAMRDKVLCINCFDRFATEVGVVWDDRVQLWGCSGARHDVDPAEDQSRAATA